ncbi:MAG: LysM peptidoglycan-binding domain-containing protein, partial [Prevotella sp.]|nr:LysM peptidoglycan-binding domain-containing protein [Prevotella sp.]
IAQKYGIQLKALYKLNNLSPDYTISAGDALRVY